MRESRTVPVDGSTTSTRSERPLKSQSSAQMLTRWLWPSVRLMSTENGPPVLGQDHVVQSDPLVGERLDPPDLGGKGRVELMGERQPFAPATTRIRYWPGCNPFPSCLRWIAIAFFRSSSASAWRPIESYSNARLFSEVA